MALKTPIQKDPLPPGFWFSPWRASQDIGGREALVFIPRLHQADHVRRLKVTNHSRKPILHESLILFWVLITTLSCLSPFRWPSLLVPGSCPILCGFSTFYLCLCKCSLFKILFGFSYFACTICSLLGLRMIP